MLLDHLMPRVMLQKQLNNEKISEAEEHPEFTRIIFCCDSLMDSSAVEKQYIQEKGFCLLAWFFFVVVVLRLIHYSVILSFIVLY